MAALSYGGPSPLRTVSRDWTSLETVLGHVLSLQHRHPLGLASWTCCRSSAVAWSDRHRYAPVGVRHQGGGGGCLWAMNTRRLLTDEHDLLYYTRVVQKKW